MNRYNFQKWIKKNILTNKNDLVLYTKMSQPLISINKHQQSIKYLKWDYKTVISKN